jgi:broad specificity phosphatase PhoE
MNSPRAVEIAGLILSLCGGASVIETRDIQIVRHGATALNNSDVSVDRIRGWKDIPLSPEGKVEAKRLGREMRKDKPDVIVSSDLSRAADTAKIISKITKVPISEVSKDFRPWDVGDYAGLISKKALPLLARHVDNPDKTCPGGESFNQFRSRFLNGVRRVLERYEGKVAIVAHHRNERILVAWAKVGFPADGDIDIKVFTEKGDAPGTVREMAIPMEAFDNFRRAEGKSAEKKPAPQKYPKEAGDYVK